jgi:hypothetical protein
MGGYLPPLHTGAAPGALAGLHAKANRVVWDYAMPETRPF